MIRSWLGGMLNFWRTVNRLSDAPPWKHSDTTPKRMVRARKHMLTPSFGNHPIRMPEKWRWWHRSVKNADLTSRRHGA